MTPPMPIKEFDERKPDEYYAKLNTALNVYKFLKNNSSTAFADDELGFLICRGFPKEHEEFLKTYNDDLKKMEKNKAKEAMCIYSQVYLKAYEGLSQLKDEKRNNPDEYPEIESVDDIFLETKNLDGRQYFILRRNL